MMKPLQIQRFREVGATGFEPATFRPPARRDRQEMFCRADSKMRVGLGQEVRTAPLPADVSNPPAVERAVAAPAEGLGGLVTAAAVDCGWAPTGEMDLEEWARTIAVNLSGARRRNRRRHQRRRLARSAGSQPSSWCPETSRSSRPGRSRGRVGTWPCPGSGSAQCARRDGNSPPASGFRSTSSTATSLAHLSRRGASRDGPARVPTRDGGSRRCGRRSARSS